MQTSDVLTGFDIVHHGEEDPADGVAQRNGVADSSAVDANWNLDIRFNINKVLNGVRGTVLAGFHSDFIQMAKTADHQGPGVLNEDFGVKTVHDLVVKFQRLDERCCWLVGFSIRNRPVVLQTEQEAPRFAVEWRQGDGSQEGPKDGVGRHLDQPKFARCCSDSEADVLSIDVHGPFLRIGSLHTTLKRLPCSHPRGVVRLEQSWRVVGKRILKHAFEVGWLLVKHASLDVVRPRHHGYAFSGVHRKGSVHPQPIGKPR